MSTRSRFSKAPELVVEGNLNSCQHRAASAASHFFPKPISPRREELAAEPSYGTLCRSEVCSTSILSESAQRAERERRELRPYRENERSEDEPSEPCLESNHHLVTTSYALVFDSADHCSSPDASWAGVKSISAFSSLFARAE